MMTHASAGRGVEPLVGVLVEPAVELPLDREPVQLAALRARPLDEGVQVGAARRLDAVVAVQLLAGGTLPRRRLAGGGCAPR